MNPTKWPRIHTVSQHFMSQGIARQMIAKHANPTWLATTANPSEVAHENSQRFLCSVPYVQSYIYVYMFVHQLRMHICNTILNQMCSGFLVGFKLSGFKFITIDNYLIFNDAYYRNLICKLITEIGCCPPSKCINKSFQKLSTIP